MTTVTNSYPNIDQHSSYSNCQKPCLGFYSNLNFYLPDFQSDDSMNHTLLHEAALLLEHKIFRVDNYHTYFVGIHYYHRISTVCANIQIPIFLYTRHEGNLSKVIIVLALCSQILVARKNTINLIVVSIDHGCKLLDSLTRSRVIIYRVRNY